MSKPGNCNKLVWPYVLHVFHQPRLQLQKHGDRSQFRSQVPTNLTRSEARGGMSQLEQRLHQACHSGSGAMFGGRWGPEPRSQNRFGYGSKLTTRGPQVLVLVSIHQGSILGTDFCPTAIWVDKGNPNQVLTRLGTGFGSAHGEPALLHTWKRSGRKPGFLQ